MQVGSMLLCAVVTLGSGFCASTARADDSGDGSADEDKSEPDESSEGKSEAGKAEGAEGAEEAENPRPEGPRFEISVTTTLASYSKLSYTLEMPVLGDTDGAIAYTAFGPSANPVTIEFGYLFSSQLSLGLLLELGSTSTHTTAESPLDIDEVQTLGRLMIGPRASYSFSDSGSVRPFAMAAVGFTYAPQQDSADARSLALTGFEGIAGLGLHWFLLPTFSVELALRGGYGVGSGRVDQSYEIGGMTVTSNVPVQGSLLTGQALIGVSGWL